MMNQTLIFTLMLITLYIEIYYTAFKNAFIIFIRPKLIDTFGIHNPIGLQLLTKLRLGFSHLNEHKFWHNFRDFLNPLCEGKLEQKQHPTFCYAATYSR